MKRVFNQKKSLNWGVVALFSVLVSACAAQNANLSPVENKQRFEAFETGKTRLTCGIPCSGRYGYNRRILRQLHDQGDWTQLASNVLLIGFSKAQPYYYLGRAAEGLGHHEAAKTYYAMAIALNANFSSILTDGFVFPRDIEHRLEIIAGTRPDTSTVRSTFKTTKDLAPDSPSALRDAENLGEMIKRRPTNQYAMYGSVHERTPRNAAERTYLDKVKAADQMFIDVILAKGVTRKAAAAGAIKRAWKLFHTGDIATAITRFNQAWRLDPENGDAYYGFALVTSERNGNATHVENYFHMAFAKPTFSVAAVVDYGRFLWTQDRLDESLIQLNRALAMEPRAKNARSHMAHVFYLKENPVEACKWARLAAQHGEKLEPGFTKEMCSHAES